MPVDDLFIEQLRQGLPEAYADLVQQFEEPLYRFFFCDHRSSHLAEEQTAETFAQLVRSLPGMRGGIRQLRAYVFATARHVQLRRWRRRKVQSVSLAEAVNVSDPAPSPSELLAVREQLDRALAAISRLDDPVRNVLLLRFVEDCSIEEIADILEMQAGTVKSHIHRGRAQLKAILVDEECKS
jgi:RNA polymerase sigma-70 factor, ECF subfamily